MKPMLKVRLAERGMTARELAERVGTTPSTVSRWSHGALAKLTLEKLEAVARAIGCRVADLFEDGGADG